MRPFHVARNELILGRGDLVDVGCHLVENRIVFRNGIFHRLIHFPGAKQRRNLGKVGFPFVALPYQSGQKLSGFGQNCQRSQILRSFFSTSSASWKFRSAPSMADESFAAANMIMPRSAASMSDAAVSMCPANSILRAVF